MKKHLFIFIIFFLISCNKNTIKAQETDNIRVNAETINEEIIEIGNLYQPEKMEVQQSKNNKEYKNENYQITLTNSDVLDKEENNLNIHSEKIVALYYKNLIRNSKSLDFDTIAVTINHRNGNIDIFKYDKVNFINKPIEIPNNSKFTIKIKNKENKDLEYSLIEIEAFNPNEETILFNKKENDETLSFCLIRNNNGSNRLVMQSNSETSIKFKLEIQAENGEEFEEIPNVGTHKGSRTTENWAKKTSTIRLSNFTIK